MPAQWQKELWKLEGHTWTSSANNNHEKRRTMAKQQQEKERNRRKSIQNSVHISKAMNKWTYNNKTCLFLRYTFFYNCFFFIYTFKNRSVRLTRSVFVVLALPLALSMCIYDISALFLTFWNWSQFVWRSRNKRLSLCSFQSHLYHRAEITEVPFLPALVSLEDPDTNHRHTKRSKRHKAMHSEWETKMKKTKINLQRTLR